MLFISTGDGVRLRSSGPTVHEAIVFVIGSASGSDLGTDCCSLRVVRRDSPVTELKLLPKYFGKIAPRMIRSAGMQAQTMAISHSRTDQ